MLVSSESVLIGRGRTFDRTPIAAWQAEVRCSTANMRQRLHFMTPEHHVVRNFVVVALPRFRRPLTIAEIAAQTAIPAPYLQQIVEDLERNLFFLVRNPAGDVAWAFPVTAETTPHQLSISDGTQTFGACAEDAFASAWVLGQLNGTRLRADIQCSCGQSGRPLRLTVESNLICEVRTAGAEPLLFTPNVNWESFRAPNIINDY
jgi:hypothetical protein